MERGAALEVLGAFHAARGDFYAGGPDAQLRALLTARVEWDVPGRNAIAGRYRGIDEVMAYFARRRDLAARSLRMEPGEVLVGDGDHVAVLTDGVAVVGGREARWSTVGLYRISGRRIAAGRLLALDQAAFDRIWA